MIIERVFYNPNSLWLLKYYAKKNLLWFHSQNGKVFYIFVCLSVSFYICIYVVPEWMDWFGFSIFFVLKVTRLTVFLYKPYIYSRNMKNNLWLKDNFKFVRHCEVHRSTMKHDVPNMHSLVIIWNRFKFRSGTPIEYANGSQLNAISYTSSNCVKAKSDTQDLLWCLFETDYVCTCNLEYLTSSEVCVKQLSMIIFKTVLKQRIIISINMYCY